MRKSSILFCFSFILLVSLLLFSGSVALSEDKILTIGNIATLTGPSSDVLKIAAEGADIAADYINDRGGVSIGGEKYKIKLILQDTKMSADGAASAATSLIYDHKVKFISGGYPPFITSAIHSVTEPAGVVYAALYNCGTAEEYNRNIKYKFIVNNGSLEGQITAMTYLKELHPEVKTIAYILVDDGQIRDNDPHVRASAKKLGFTLAGDIIGWTLDTVDFAPIAMKAVVRKPDAIMTGNGSTDMSGSIIKNAREMGFTKPIFACNYNPAVDTLQVAGKDAATNYFTHGISENTPDLPPLTNEIVKRAVKKYGRLDIAQLFGFNGIYIMVQAMEKANSLDPAKVTEAWEQMDDVDTSFGPGRMGGMEAYGIKHSVYHPIPIQRLENGTMQHATWIQIYRP